MATRKSFGSWTSPITTSLLTQGKVGLSSLKACRSTGAIYWEESRPTEQGRNVLVRHAPSTSIADINAAPSNCRTRVHEYGGAAYTLVDGGKAVAFSEFVGQQLMLSPTGKNAIIPCHKTQHNNIRVL